LVFEPHENPKMAVQTLTNGHGVDAVIICASSKTSEPLDLGVDLSRSRATIVVVGMIKMEMSWEAVYRKELKLVVSRAYGPGSYDPLYEKKGVDYPIDYVRWTENRNMAEFLRLMKDGKIQTKHIITHEFPLLEAPIAYQQLASGQKGVLGVVLRYPDFNLREKPKEMRISLNNVSPKSHSAKDQLRVGIIGLGNIARWVHLPNVSNHPKLILKGVCTPKGYKAKHFGIRFKSEYCTTDYKQIIEDPEIDLVMICTRHDLHASMATEALNAGKHVFLEKPMALTREECLRLVQLVKETGLGFMVNFNRRFSPIYQVAKETISGKGPKLMSIRMNSPDMTGSYWMMDPVEGGGAVLGEGCHFFDLMAWFTNSAPVSVFARNLSFHDDPLVSKNNIACTLSFEDGSVGNLVYETIGNRRLGSERLEISAGGVSVVVEDARRLQIWKGFFSKLKSRKKLKAEKGYYEILHEFVEGVLRGRSFEEEARAGAQATLCALAALKSLETGIPESIEAI
jgi:predicted dehydrogenase